MQNRGERQCELTFAAIRQLKNRLGGITAHGLLVTTEDIGANLNKANLLNVGVIDGHQLKELKMHLRNWILNEISHSPQPNGHAS